MTRYRTALIGAGFIAGAHVSGLKAGAGEAELTALVDRNLSLAEARARQWGIPNVYAGVDDMIAAGVADVAHVLAPPDAHAALARPLIDAGLHVFLEKPMATSVADCNALTEAARARNVMLGVNQNFVFHPTYRAARRILLDERRLGPMRSLQVAFNVPLRQLAARQFGHWMFREPVNILLEQAVHPLSQIVDLVGTPTEIDGRPAKPLALSAGQVFYDRWHADLMCGNVPVQLSLAFGQSFHAWRFMAICDDGILVCDLSAGRVMVQGRAQWPEFLDNMVTGAALAGNVAVQSVGGALGYMTGLLGLRPKSDGFSASMRESIAAYYRGLSAGRVPLDGAFGGTLVGICEALATNLPVHKSSSEPAKPRPKKTEIAPDVLILGGTGFIGSYLVAALVDAGRAVRVMARGVPPSQPPFDSALVEFVRGDVTQRADIERAMLGVKQVVNLAHGGGGADWEAIKRVMVDSAVAVAECAAAAGVRRLVHVGSIAGLYLGDPDEIITGGTPVDPEAAHRNLYARGKAEADLALALIARDKGLELVILRPGLVVGAGTPALHGGLGFFNNEQHVIGWNAGANPLPFVLVDDVARAIVAAIDVPVAAGKTYNLVGDVRPTATEFVKMVADATHRPLAFHPQSVDWLYAAELFKWVIKRATGRTVDLPSRRDLLSRGLRARFDCEGAKRDLDWHPVADRAAFIAKAVDVHQMPFERVP